MHRRAAISIAAVMLALAGCAQTPAALPPGTVRIAPDLTLVLPHPGELGQTLEVTQLVTAHYGERTFVFEGHLSATPDRILLVSLDAMGRKAITVTWTDAGLDTEVAPWLPDGIRPENMLADIVLLYWPEASVRHALAASHGTLDASKQSRSVGVGGKEVIHADYQPGAGGDPWSGSLRYRNLPWGYELEVQSARVSP
ncbi:MAG TPA: DUF3261 domain-containing protein [Patescibacteria group bacterium]|nr:DUF3261 domain-containing protein [Patescibacteria group bacterium]